MYLYKSHFYFSLPKYSNVPKMEQWAMMGSQIGSRKECLMPIDNIRVLFLAF